MPKIRGWDIMNDPDFERHLDTGTAVEILGELGSDLDPIWVRGIETTAEDAEYDGVQRGFQHNLAHLCRITFYGNKGDGRTGRIRGSLVDMCRDRYQHRYRNTDWKLNAPPRRGSSTLQSIHEIAFLHKMKQEKEGSYRREIEKGGIRLSIYLCIVITTNADRPNYPKIGVSLFTSVNALYNAVQMQCLADAALEAGSVMHDIEVDLEEIVDVEFLGAKVQQ